MWNTDGTGFPLAVTLTGAHRNDVTQLIPLLEAVPPVRGKRGRLHRGPHVGEDPRVRDHPGVESRADHCQERPVT
jgi:hypothetical protein